MSDDLDTAERPPPPQRQAAAARRRDIEERLRRSEARFRSVFDQAAIGIAIVDENAKVRSANSRLAEILDRGDADEIEGTDFLEWVVPASRELARRSLTQAAADGTSFAAELQMLRSSGGGVWVKTTSSAFEPHTGDHTVVVSVEDISERRRSEQALQEAAQHKDEFLAMLGHELRNPLAALRYSTDLLESLVEGDATLQRIQQIFDRQVNQMSRLVADLLDVSRIARGKLSLQRETLDLNTLVAQVIQDSAALFGSDQGVTITTELPDSPSWVFGDGSRLAQVLDNLVCNARKFTEAPGEVKVTLRQESGELVLEVIDSGIGMEQELIDRIFEPFRQLEPSQKRAEGGLGLGLSIVRGVVDQHGGTVGAESGGAGQGSRFWVRLSASQPRADQRTDRSDPGVGRVPAGVLLVDDHVDTLETLQLILEDAGHRVNVAHDGARALEVARAEPPEIVFCDIRLPGELDGYDLVRAFREDEALRRAAMIAITGFGRREDRERALEAGFDDHLAKPVGSQDLLAAVHRAHQKQR